MNTETNTNHNPHHATGPRTPAGKAVSSQNAVTHGLHATQTVLTQFGEDPAVYDAMQKALHEQLRPRNLMEQQYLTLWLQAAWKLQRLQRLEDQAWNTAGNSDTDEDALLSKIERLTRLQSTLRRQMDRALRLLTSDLPNLFARRTREDVLRAMNLTESILDKYPYRKDEVEKAVQANTCWPAFGPTESQNSQNELLAPAEDTEQDTAQDMETETREGELVAGERVADNVQNVQNELSVHSPSPTPPLSEGGGGERSETEGVPDPLARACPQRSGIRPRISASLPPTVINEAEETRQKYENALNDGSIPWEERLLLMDMVGRARIQDTGDGFRVHPS